MFREVNNQHGMCTSSVYTHADNTIRCVQMMRTYTSEASQSFERPIRQFYDRIRDDLLENRIRFQILFSQRRYFFIRSLYFKTVKNFLRQRRFVCIRIYKNVSISFRDAPDIRIIRSFIIYPVTTDNKI